MISKPNLTLKVDNTSSSKRIIPGVQDIFNIYKPINVIHNEKSRMIITVDSDRPFDKIQHQFC